ncbi:MAG: enoyl-CoA hydratase/isomerase family protein [Alphaproteobacteria bacterium]|nr:enoyl-CoA hydratase/isomerase family protein [Alphaproteobacteria bacterium]
MSLHLTQDGPIARLCIDRAEKRNAFTHAMWAQLPALLGQAVANPATRLLILQSAVPGSAFCAGADIAELLSNGDDAGWRAANQAAINRAQHDLARLALPTIAFVEGDAVGGGCGLAMACDIRVATPAARFGITPAKLGLVYPLHDVKLLVDLVGPGQARRLLFTAALIDAAEAWDIGLIEVVAAAPDAIVAAILAGSPHSIRAMKGFVRRVLDGQVADDAETLAVFAAAFAGADFAEGTAAFLARRPPQFRA